MSLLTIVVSACVNDPQPGLVVPSVYDSTMYSLNTATEIALIDDSKAFIKALQVGRTSGIKLNEAAILGQFDALAPFIDPSARAQTRIYVQQVVAASGGVYDWAKDASSNGQGGVYGDYLFTKEGLDATELIEKQLFSILFQYHANTLFQGTITSATIDKLVATYGAHPVFSNSEKAVNHPDHFVAKYAARRDKNDGTGMYTKISASLRKAQAAVKAGSGYNAELNDALKEFRTQWERALMATTVSYCYAVASGLSQTTLDDATRSSAIHSFGEAAGYLLGLASVPQSQRIMTTETLNIILTKMGLPPGGQPSCWLVWQDPFTSLPLLIEITKMIAATYGFGPTEMESFKINWVATQNRQ